MNWNWSSAQADMEKLSIFECSPEETPPTRLSRLPTARSEAPSTSMSRPSYTIDKTTRYTPRNACNPQPVLPQELFCSTIDIAHYINLHIPGTHARIHMRNISNESTPCHRPGSEKKDCHSYASRVTSRSSRNSSWRDERRPVPWPGLAGAVLPIGSSGIPPYTQVTESAPWQAVISA